MVIQKKTPDDKVVALAGNPNVGKSTVFNGLTGMRQHTGNWPGKTVASAQGFCQTKKYSYTIVDLPGTYSLMAHSAEEEVARDFLCFENPDIVLVVCDATCLERNLNLVLQTMEISQNVIVCVNFMDEAKKKNITLDLEMLSRHLGVPVVGIVARKKSSLHALMQVMDRRIDESRPESLSYTGEKLPESDVKDKDSRKDQRISVWVQHAEKIAQDVVRYENPKYNAKDRRLDKIFTSKRTGYPLMFALLALVFWLSIIGANYPSQLLSGIFFQIQDRLTELFEYINAPEWLHGVLVLGVYRVLAWVVSVMLPPMAIFFPLFTLLEDSGYLPRIAYNLDKPFQYCHACGKQALCMCMGFGCNAVGVIGCRIIDSPRERLLAILTNNFVPCNGRFPTLIAIFTMFFAGAAGGIWSSLESALLLAGAIVLSVFITLGMTKVLSLTLLKGVPSSFILELPPYRKPQVGKVIVRSVFDRTFFVLRRAVAVAAPAGMIIWLMANITVGGVSLLNHLASFLDPFARLMGLDGVILMAFILGFPANEIIFPIILMSYMAQGSLVNMENLLQMRVLLVQNGWTWTTAISVILFSMNHWPCSTTLLTIKKETGSWKWAAAAFVIPTLVGIAVCMIFQMVVQILL